MEEERRRNGMDERRKQILKLERRKYKEKRNCDDGSAKEITKIFE